jgi:hypothetical protein
MLRPISAARTATWMLFLAASTLAQQPARTASRPDPGDLVRKAVQNEINFSTDDHLRFMFRETKTTPKGSETKLYVETKEATAGLAVAYNGEPLTPEQRHAEEGRVSRFLSDPEELKKKRKQEREDADRTMRIVRAMPDAFQFEYAGEEPGDPRIGKPGDSLVKLNFRPNPGYQPPSRVEQVLTGMRGVIVIDDARHRIARIDGTLFKDVTFGWGILGHLDKGGHFLVEQQEIGDHRWEISRMSLDFTGKILLFKNLTIKSTEVFSDYKQVPSDLTFVQALELLKKEGAAMAENLNSGKLAPNN